MRVVRLGQGLRCSRVLTPALPCHGIGRRNERANFVRLSSSFPLSDTGVRRAYDTFETYKYHLIGD